MVCGEYMKKSVRKKEMNDVYRVTKQMRDVSRLVWVTIVAYIVYVEFIKGMI